MASDPDESRIKILGSTNCHMTGINFNAGVRTPVFLILGINYSKGNFYEHSESKMKDNGVLINREYGIYTSSSLADFTVKRRFARKAFYASTVSVEKDSSELYNDISGSFIWKYETNNGTPKKLKNAIGRLSKRTNMPKFFQLEISDENDDIGYINVETKITWSKKYTMFLMHLIQNKQDLPFREDLLRNITKKCLTKIRSLRKICLKTKIRKAKKELHYIRNRLSEMNKNIKNNKKKFVKSYRRIGQKVFNYSPLFNLFFKEGKKHGVSIHNLVTGEKIHRFEKLLVF